MRKLKLIIGAVAGALTAGAMLLLAAGASAGPPHTVITNFEGPYTGPAYVKTLFRVDDEKGLCEQIYSGAVTSGKPVVPVATIGETRCETYDPETGRLTGPLVGWTMTGALTKFKLSREGTIDATGKLQLATPGPCVYQFTHVDAALTLAFPTPIVGGGEVTGWLVLKDSVIECSWSSTTLYGPEMLAEPSPGEHLGLTAKLFG